MKIIENPEVVNLDEIFSDKLPDEVAIQMAGLLQEPRPKKSDGWYTTSQLHAAYEARFGVKITRNAFRAIIEKAVSDKIYRVQRWGDGKGTLYYKTIEGGLDDSQG